MRVASWPGQFVNAGLRLTGAPVPQLGPDDLAVATANVAAWGGRPALFRHFLAAGLAAPVPDPRQLASVAGWRAGALSLRFEALRLLPELPEAAVAAALGIAPESLADFAELQQLDPYWWPARAAGGGRVLAAGGFAGLGGPWLAPPARAGRGAITGRWVVLAGDSWWQLDADAFGAVLTALERAPECGPDTDASGIRIATNEDSYLVTLSAPAETGALR